MLCERTTSCKLTPSVCSGTDRCTQNCGNDLKGNLLTVGRRVQSEADINVVFQTPEEFVLEALLPKALSDRSTLNAA